MSKKSELHSIPNVGPATVGDLARLGITSIADLRGNNAQELYDKLAKLDGVPHDICVLDVFEAAIDYAEHGSCEPWWFYSRRRKATNK